MEPSEPTQPGTSLDLTSASGGDGTASPTAPSTDLETSSSPELLAPSAPMELSATTTDPTALGLLGDLVVARLRQTDSAMLGRVLIATLGTALPTSMIRLEQRRSIGQRLTRHSAEPIGITITAGERTLVFRAPNDGPPEASVGHVVRGVVLSSTPVPVAQWLADLGVLLNQLAREDEATRAALEQALLS